MAKREGPPSKVKTGKWLIFLDNSREAFREVWPKIRKQTELGLLGDAAKIVNPELCSGPSLVCCVYTKDWRDCLDVRRVREALRLLGFVKPLPYKSDEDTIRGNYGQGVSKYYE